MKKLSQHFNLLALSIILAISCSVKANNQDTLKAFDEVIQQHHGKVIYLDFWASWCTPCRKSFPWMNDMKAKYQEQGLVVLSVNLDANKSLAEKFLLETPAQFDIFYDSKGKVAKQFKIKGMPSSYLIDRNGELVSAHTGFNGKKKVKYEKEIQQLLNLTTE